MAPTERRHLVATLQRQIEARGACVADIAPRVSTGFASLDRALDGGWVRGALNEWVITEPGTGIVEAFVPGLARFGEHAADGAAPRLLAWIHPFKTPYPPALAAQSPTTLERWLIVRPATPDDHLWALEQALRSKACDAVVAHVGDVPDLLLRRLQLAAEEGGTLGCLMRPGAVIAQNSPAAVRLMVRPRPSASARGRSVEIEILRCRGSTYRPPLLLEWDIDSLDERVASASGERSLDADRAVGRLPAARAHGA